MAILKILERGRVELERQAEPVLSFDDSLREIAQDLWETMEAYGGVGLAAPQVGINLQLVVFGVVSSERYPDADPVPETVLINPQIEPIGGEMEEGWEGCLSIPGLRGVVPRHRRIRYSGLYLDGNRLEREVDGFHARVVQHECDHLIGLLYPDRMENPAELIAEEEMVDNT